MYCEWLTLIPHSLTWGARFLASGQSRAVPRALKSHQRMYSQEHGCDGNLQETHGEIKDELCSAEKAMWCGLKMEFSGLEPGWSLKRAGLDLSVFGEICSKWRKPGKKVRREREIRIEWSNLRYELSALTGLDYDVWQFSPEVRIESLLKRNRQVDAKVGR